MTYAPHDSGFQLPSSADRLPLTKINFARYILPTVLCYYLTAFLVVLPRPWTAVLRRALLPVSLWFTFRAATRVDIALAWREPKLNYWNHGHVVVMLVFGMRMIEWTFCRVPLERHMSRPNGSRRRSSKLNAVASSWEASCYSHVAYAVWDASDLIFNLRGLGWTWSKGLYVPSRSSGSHLFENKATFAMTTFRSAVKDFITFDCIHFIIQYLVTPAVNSPRGGSIFLTSLPLPVRYLHSTLVSILAGSIVYFGIQTLYKLVSVIGVSIFRQSPTQWPPLFDAPWRATSLADFWAKRWHQLFRRLFIDIGARPFRCIFGRVGAIMGAFLVSGLLHDWGLWGMGRGTEFPATGGFFLMMGVGILMEGALGQRILARPVGGWIGWAWTMLWTAAWANLMVDAWARRGMMASVFLPHRWRPSTVICSVLRGVVSQM